MKTQEELDKRKEEIKQYYLEDSSRINTRSSNLEPLIQVSAGATCRYVPFHEGTVGCAVAKILVEDYQADTGLLAKLDKIGSIVDVEMVVSDPDTSPIYNLDNDDVATVSGMLNDYPLEWLRDLQFWHDNECKTEL